MRTPAPTPHVPLLGLLAALSACGQGAQPLPAASPSGWTVDGPPDQRPEAQQQGEWTVLSLPEQGQASQVCHPLSMQALSRARLDWRWSVASQAPDSSVAQLVVSYLQADGGPLRGPGGQQRLLTLRGQQAASTEQRTRALLSSPAQAEGARLCLQLRGQPGAQLRLGQPSLVPLEPMGAPEPPNLLVVVVDALRADALGAYGAALGSSPEVDRFSERSLLVEHAWTQYTWTGPSFISYMSSRWARSHGWVSSWADRSAIKPRPGSDLPTLPGVLRDAGYVTVGLNANGYLDWLDASQLGFDQWSYEGDIPAIQAAQRELAYWPHDGRPNFLYVHLMATHHPLCPSQDAQRTAGVSIDPTLYRRPDNKCPRGGLTQVAADYAADGLGPQQHLATYRDAYRAAVLDADRHFGRLLQTLDEQDLLSNTVVVFASDHGELLGEHGQNGHGPWVWEPLAHVPLLLAGPGIPHSRQQQGVARLIDLAPTLLDAMGLADRQPPSWQGRSLLRDVPSPPLAVVERETWVATTLDGRHKRIATLDGSDPAQRYDLMADPGELVPTPADTSTGADVLESVSQAWLEQTPVAAPQGEQAGPELEEALRELGYVE